MLNLISNLSVEKVSAVIAIIIVFAGMIASWVTVKIYIAVLKQSFAELKNEMQSSFKFINDDLVHIRERTSRIEGHLGISHIDHE